MASAGALFAVLAVLAHSLALPLPPGGMDTTLADHKRAVEYLSHYFLYNSKAGEHGFEEKLAEMQRYFRLTVTGHLNVDTMAMMKKPRCGMPDVADFTVFPGRPKWTTTSLTYRITNYTPDLPVTTVRQIIQRAFDVWAEVTPLSFRRVNSRNADIVIQFASGSHGDGLPFDGQGNVLAHAYAPGPGIGGDAHFDEDEKWTTTQLGTNLFLVAAHEFGHSLGLSHSEDPSALMYPFYAYVRTNNYHLPRDDVRGIQSLYGRRW
ncbi:matrilysin [Ambystoma mexicanum]|uniref:matrilysin n=1 Tax=Ambystoma mexicanum TaxID=8296 RepID=UPI0037E86390